MNYLTTPLASELTSLIAEELDLTNAAIVTKATKFVRFDWKTLIQRFQLTAGSEGNEPPWCILRFGPSEQAEDFSGMSNLVYRIPCEIFLIEDERNAISTDIVSVTGPASAILGSVERLFVGQYLWIKNDVTEIVQILTINTNTDEVTFVGDVGGTFSPGMDVISDITKDIEQKIEKIRNILKPGFTFTNFQVVDDPEMDISDMNPANEFFEKDNYNILAGSLFLRCLVGETGGN
jgi:hypothetical protein